jgi:hypothetical protein
MLGVAQMCYLLMAVALRKRGDRYPEAKFPPVTINGFIESAGAPCSSTLLPESAPPIKHERNSGAIAEVDHRYMPAQIVRQTAKDSDSDPLLLRGLLILRAESHRAGLRLSSLD